MNTTLTGQIDFTNPRLEAHMLFICPECGEEHPSQQEWRRHLNEEHEYLRKTATDFNFKEINERYHECLVCHKWVANAKQAIALLQYHRFLHLPYNRTYRCRHCKGAFSRKRALCEHLYRFHSRQIIRIEKFKRAMLAAETKSLRNPRENSEFYLRFQCPQCGKSIDRYQQWLQHIETAHQTTSTDLRMHRITGTKGHYCLQCKKLIYTTDKSRLQRHRFTHLPHKMYFKCAFCVVKKAYKSEVLRHFIQNHDHIFEGIKAYVRKPIEWGGTISNPLDIELNLLLKRRGPTYSSGSDVHAAPSMDRLDEETHGSNGSSSRGSSSGVGGQKKNDLIQKALLDSLIDLENETASSSKSIINTKRSSRNPNDFALDQSLNDLEEILRNDIESDKGKISLESGHQMQHDRINLDGYELDDLCTEIFEVLDEEEEGRNKNNGAKQTLHNIFETANNMLIKAELKTEVDVDTETESEGKVISIEIDAIDSDCEHVRSPQRKRLKVDEPANREAQKQKLKALQEQYINYLCPECGKEFRQQCEWREHVFNKHNLANTMQTNFKLLKNKTSYLCLECCQVQYTTRQSELQRHRFMHMPFQAYLKCTLCRNTKSSKPKMLQHMQEHHMETLKKKLQYQDSKIAGETGTTTNVTAGFSGGLRDRVSGLLKCENCDKEFKIQSRWRNHRNKCTVKNQAYATALAMTTTQLTTSKHYCSIADNLKLLEHLKKARARMREILTSYEKS